MAIDNVQAVRQLSELTSHLKEETRYLEEELSSEYSFEEIVGQRLMRSSKRLPKASRLAMATLDAFSAWITKRPIVSLTTRVTSRAATLRFGSLIQTTLA